MASPRVRRPPPSGGEIASPGSIASRNTHVASPRAYGEDFDDGGGPAAADVAALSTWRPKPSGDDDAAAEAATALRQRFGLGPVTLAPATGRSVDVGGSRDPAELQAALAEKTREAERLHELLLAITPAPGVVPSKLADIQAGKPGPNGLPPDPRDSKILDLSRATRKVREGCGARWRASAWRQTHSPFF